MGARQKIEGERDLIAELRKAAEQIAAAGHAGWGNTCLDAAQLLATHDAEIARLREALTEINDLYSHDQDRFSLATAMYDASCIARAALTPQPPKEPV